MGAIDYDLMTLTAYTVDDIGGALAWPRLLNFLRHLPNSSALRREVNGEASAWLNGANQATLLADIYDLLNMFRYEHACSKAKEKNRPNKPDPYPRPQAQAKKSGKPFDYEALRARLYK